MRIIKGQLNLGSGERIGTAAGMVRLEDVTSADLPSKCVAEAAVCGTAGSPNIPFRLEIPTPLDTRRRYELSADLLVAEHAGEVRHFVVSKAHVWNPLSSPEEKNIVTVDAVIGGGSDGRR